VSSGAFGEAGDVARLPRGSESYEAHMWEARSVGWRLPYGPALRDDMCECMRGMDTESRTTNRRAISTMPCVFTAELVESSANRLP